LAVSGATEAVAFYTAAFGAVERYRLEDDGGGVIVAQLAIGGADFWVQDDADSSPMPDARIAVRIILTVADPDAVFAQALAAGATAVGAVAEEHGWRSGRLIDPFGHDWEIARPLP
jgi:PhnB protein